MTNYKHRVNIPPHNPATDPEEAGDLHRTYLIKHNDDEFGRPDPDGPWWGAECEDCDWDMPGENGKHDDAEEWAIHHYRLHLYGMDLETGATL